MTEIQRKQIRNYYTKMVAKLSTREVRKRKKNGESSSNRNFANLVAIWAILDGSATFHGRLADEYACNLPYWVKRRLRGVHR